MAAYGMTAYYGDRDGGAQNYSQPSYGSNYNTGRRRSFSYNQNPSDAYRRRSSSLDYEPGGAGRYSRRQSFADPYGEDDRMARQRLMEDLDYQIQEKKRIEQMRREKELYEEHLLDQNIERQRKQMEEEYQREQNIKRMKEEQRRKRHAAHEAYLASLEQQYRGKSVERPRPPPDSPEVPSSHRSSELGVDPTSQYSAYESTPVKGKGTYDYALDDNVGPRSKPPGWKSKRPPTPKPEKSRSSPKLSSPDSRSGSSGSNPPKSYSGDRKSRQSRPTRAKSDSSERAKLTPPREKNTMLEPRSNDSNNNKAPSRMDLSMTDLPKRRKIPSSDDSSPLPAWTRSYNASFGISQSECRGLSQPRFDFGLNLKQASQNTLHAQKDGNPFFDSKPGRRRKTPDPRNKAENKPTPPSPRPQSLPNYHLQPTPSPPNQRTPSPRAMMDSEVQTSDSPRRNSTPPGREERGAGTKKPTLRVENGAQTYDDDFEPENPPPRKPRPTPFDWKIKLDETTSDWRRKHEEESKNKLKSFEEQHKDLASQLLAMKKGLKGEDDGSMERPRSRSSNARGSEGRQDSDGAGGGGRPASSDGVRGRSGGRRSHAGNDGKASPVTDDLIDLENTDRTVLGAYLNKTGHKSNPKSGSGNDGRRTGGYTPSSGDKTRNGTPETDRDATDRKSDSGDKKRDSKDRTNDSEDGKDDSNDKREDSGNRRSNSGNWDETPNFLRRKETFDLDATDRTLLTKYVDRNRRH